ncbi:MAG TPA: hypothetical protein PKZ24_07210 [Nitrospirales bacterium]|nr:hypothetical protein [Nitrospirales bacterium]
MRRKSFINCLISILFIWAWGTQALAASTSAPTVELPAVIHFLTPAGEDIEVRPGVYQVEATESWLKLVPEGEARSAAVLLDATQGNHEETLTEPIVRATADTDNPDVFNLAMLLQDGTGLEAVGTVSGIRPRALNLAFVGRTSKAKTLAARPKISLPGPVGQTQAPPPRPQLTCGPVTTREIGTNIGEIAGYLAQPALAVFGNQVHLRVSYRKDRNWTDYLPPYHFDGVPGFKNHYIFDGRSWTPVSFTTNEKVALAVYDRNLWAVWRDKDKQLWFSRYYDQWAPPAKIPGQYSKSTPALAVRRGVLHMVHNGKSSDDLWHSTFTPRTQWTPNVKIGQQSRTTPGFTLGSDGNLHMVYLGAAKRLRPDPEDLWYSQFNGSRWTTPYTIHNQFSKASPTLLGAGTTSPLLPLLMVHLGKSEDTLWHALYGKNPRLPAATQQNRWHVNERLLGKTSDGPVGLTFFQGCIHMVHKEGKKLMHTTYSAKDVHSGLP